MWADLIGGSGPSTEYESSECLLAHTSESQSAESTGTKILVARAKCLVSTLSKMGEVTAAAIIPARSNVAPMNPEVSSEYPCGEKY